MKKVAVFLVLVTIVFALCGCKELAEPGKRSVNPENFEQPADYQQHVRNNSASLLYDLLKDEKNVSKLLLIKRNSSDLGDVIKNIASTAAREVKELEELAQTDRTLDLQVMGLPSGESATRKAESETKEQELLHASGAELQFKLLLSQAEALNYGAHLAKVAAANETNPNQASRFAAMDRDLLDLYVRVIALLRKTK